MITLQFSDTISKIQAISIDTISKIQALSIDTISKTQALSVYQIILTLKWSLNVQFEMQHHLIKFYCDQWRTVWENEPNSQWSLKIWKVWKNLA